jgi:hypothetical protein
MSTPTETEIEALRRAWGDDSAAAEDAERIASESWRIYNEAYVANYSAKANIKDSNR